MSEKTVDERVRDIIIDEMGCDLGELEGHKRLNEDLGADSLDAVEIIITLEEEFKIEIPDEDVDKLVTVQDVINYVKKKIAPIPA